MIKKAEKIKVQDDIIKGGPDPSGKDILRVEGLKKYFPVRRGFFQNIVGWIKAVDGVDLSIGRRKTLGLVGESGCGKSTIGQLILKLIDPDGGKIIYRDKEISSLSQGEIKPLRKEMQIIFQDPFGSLNPRMTVAMSSAEAKDNVSV
jgi:ABC-type oligopeptide transport system ATPase subunit